MKKETNKEYRVFVWSAISAVIIVVLWIATYFLLRYEKERGAFGDMFGGINALYSGLALAGIIFSLLLQRLELGLQRQELSDTRKEFKIQNQTLALQRYENTFFNLLSIHNQIVNEMYDVRQQFMGTGVPTMQRGNSSNFQLKRINGRNFISDFIQKNNSYLNIGAEKINVVQRRNLKVSFDVVSHYIGNIGNILKFIKNIELPFESKKSETEIREFKSKLLSIFEGLLSSDELHLIFLWCIIHKETGAEMKELVNEFGLFRKISGSSKISASKNSFAESAYIVYSG